MKFGSLFVLIAAIPVTQALSADWKYPREGVGVTTSKLSLGKVGQFHTYQTMSPDNAEKVVLWYAKQLGLKENDSLVKAAKAGFHKLEHVTDGSHGIVVDTDTKKWGVVIISTLSADHANVQILVRPENDPKNDLTISINQTPKGTMISVIQSVPFEGNKNVAKSK